MKKLTSQVQVDNITSEISRMFDYEFNGQTEFTLPNFQKPTQDFNIGLIVGASGSGKSSLLKEFGQEENIVWDKLKNKKTNPKKSFLIVFIFLFLYILFKLL